MGEFLLDVVIITSVARSVAIKVLDDDHVAGAEATVDVSLPGDDEAGNVDNGCFSLWSLAQRTSRERWVADAVGAERVGAGLKYFK